MIKLHLEILEKEQKTLWEKLIGVSWLEQFYLAGGTALALHFGHRKSVDFDFFSKNTFKNDIIIEKLEKLGKVQIDNNSNDTLLASVNDVKFLFFLYRHPTLIEPYKYKSLQIASIDDIAVMKLIAISQRGTKKDFVDLWMILEQGYNLTLLFELMDRKFEGTKYNKAHIIKSLTFFEDAESDPDPIMLMPGSWQTIRRDLIKTALKLN